MRTMKELSAELLRSNDGATFAYLKYLTQSEEEISEASDEALVQLLPMPAWRVIHPLPAPSIF